MFTQLGAISAIQTTLHSASILLELVLKESCLLTEDEGPGSLGVIARYPGTLKLAGPARRLSSPPLRRAPLGHTGAAQGNKSY